MMYSNEQVKDFQQSMILNNKIRGKILKEQSTQKNSSKHLVNKELVFSSLSPTSRCYKQEKKSENIVTARTYQQHLKETSSFIRNSGLQGQKFSLQKEQLKKFVGQPLPIKFQQEQQYNSNAIHKQITQFLNRKYQQIKVEGEGEANILNDSWQSHIPISPLKLELPKQQSPQIWREGVILSEDQKSIAQLSNQKNLKKTLSLSSFRLFSDQKSPLRLLNSNRIQKDCKDMSGLSPQPENQKQIDDSKQLQSCLKFQLDKDKNAQIQDPTSNSFQRQRQSLKKKDYPFFELKQPSLIQNLFVREEIEKTMNPSNSVQSMNINNTHTNSFESLLKFTTSSNPAKKSSQLQKQLNFIEKMNIPKQHQSSYINLQIQDESNLSRKESDSQMQPRIHSKVLEENNNDFDERDILNPIWQSKEQLSAKPISSSSRRNRSMVNKVLILSKKLTDPNRKMKTRNRNKYFMKMYDVDEISLNIKSKEENITQETRSSFLKSNSQKCFQSFQSTESFSKMIENTIQNFTSPRVVSPAKKSLIGISSQLKLQEAKLEKAWSKKIISQSLVNMEEIKMLSHQK